jgi:hypothetical protein
MSDSLVLVLRSYVGRFSSCVTMICRTVEFLWYDDMSDGLDLVLR